MMSSHKKNLHGSTALRKCLRSFYGSGGGFSFYGSGGRGGGNVFGKSFENMSKTKSKVIEKVNKTSKHCHHTKKRKKRKKKGQVLRYRNSMDLESTSSEYSFHRHMSIWGLRTNFVSTKKRNLVLYPFFLFFLFFFPNCFPTT